MNRENNYTKELDQDEVGLIEEYKEKGKLHPDFLPFVTYDMVQLGYPKPDHGEMIARDHGGSDSEGRMLPSDGKWCKVEDVLKLINQSLPKEEVNTKAVFDAWYDKNVARFH
jgi:hypothetical protein